MANEAFLRIGRLACAPLDTAEQFAARDRDTIRQRSQQRVLRRSFRIAGIKAVAAAASINTPGAATKVNGSSGARTSSDVSILRPRLSSNSSLPAGAEWTREPMFLESKLQAESDEPRRHEFGRIPKRLPHLSDLP